MNNRELERMVKRMYESMGNDVLVLRMNGKDVAKIARELDSTFQDTVGLLCMAASEAKVVKE